MLGHLCRCGAILKTQDFPGCQARRCDSCAYLFLAKEDKEAAFAVVERHYKPRDLDDLEKICLARKEKLLQRSDDEVLYRNCPDCGQQMARKNFAHVSGIIMHECLNDGVAGDLNWLAQAQDFVKKGGEVLALRDQLSQLQNDLSQVKAESQSTIDKMKREGLRHGIILFPV